MPKCTPASRGNLAGHLAQRSSPAEPEPFIKLLQSCVASSTSSEGPESAREESANYADGIHELVVGWLMEDLDVTASVCQASPEEVFEDVLSAMVSDAPQFHSSETSYADAVEQLLGWMLDDIGSIARSFDLDPADVFGDALKLIVSDTPLADHIIEAAGLPASAFASGGD